jgi:hypothetical protein
MQDEVSTVLGDWSTPQSELAKKCEDVLIDRTKDIAQKNLSFALMSVDVETEGVKS